MKRRDHVSAEAARRELAANGFYPRHVPPGDPEIWQRPRNRGGVRAGRFNIAREERARCTKFHIVPA